VFMLEAQFRGHNIYFLELRDLYARGRHVMARARRCELTRRGNPHYKFLDEGADYPIEHFDAVFMRKDPPANAAYLYATMLLSLADERQTFVLNNPAGLREANEKLYSLNFPDAIPPTLVTYEIPKLKAFLAEQGGEMIVKPLDGHGGEGVFLATSKDRNLGAILETVTQFETRLIMAQRYLPEARKGDKRLIVLNGDPLGCTLRVPRDDEHRGNIHVGGNCVKAVITERDRDICRMLKPRLERDGLYFVGLDIIGDYLTEVNVTSPTGVQEIDRLNGANLEGKVIDFVESRVAALKQ
jgi:glutathione synthase